MIMLMKLRMDEVCAEGDESNSKLDMILLYSICLSKRSQQIGTDSC